VTVAAGEVVWHRLTLRDLGEVDVAVAPIEGNDRQAAIAVCHGDWKNRRGETIPVRVQSACAYGEVLHSIDCDCGDQLRLARQKILDAGIGILIYLPQEGRGLGSVAKAMGYRYAEEHQADSFEAYAQLGFPVDARDYSCAAELLAHLGVFRLCLMTNNPAKLDAFDDRFDLERAELWPRPMTVLAKRYRAAKIARGHMAPLPRRLKDTIRRTHREKNLVSL
jgi:GTP cyclohydrolase II